MFIFVHQCINVKTLWFTQYLRKQAYDDFDENYILAGDYVPNDWYELDNFDKSYILARDYVPDG